MSATSICGVTGKDRSGGRHASSLAEGEEYCACPACDQVGEFHSVDGPVWCEDCGFDERCNPVLVIPGAEPMALPCSPAGPKALLRRVLFEAAATLVLERKLESESADGIGADSGDDE